MARITDALLVQRVEDQMVVMDEFTGQEVAFSVTVTPRVIAAMTYLTEEET